MDNTFESPDPIVQTCACGQKVQWYPVISRRSIVISFQKNLFEYGARFEYPIPSDGPLQFGCTRCRQAITVQLLPETSATKPEREKTAPVRLPEPAPPPDRQN